MPLASDLRSGPDKMVVESSLVAKGNRDLAVYAALIFER
jgi:hypothetical protein